MALEQRWVRSWASNCARGERLRRPYGARCVAVKQENAVVAVAGGWGVRSCRNDDVRPIGGELRNVHGGGCCWHHRNARGSPSSCELQRQDGVRWRATEGADTAVLSVYRYLLSE